MKCVTCNGKGYVPDGRKSANSGLPCPDCLDPAVARFLESDATHRKISTHPQHGWYIGKRRTKGRAFHSPHRGRHTRGRG